MSLGKTANVFYGLLNFTVIVLSKGGIVILSQLIAVFIMPVAFVFCGFSKACYLSGWLCVNNCSDASPDM